MQHIEVSLCDFHNGILTKKEVRERDLVIVDVYKHDIYIARKEGLISYVDDNNLTACIKGNTEVLKYDPTEKFPLYGFSFLDAINVKNSLNKLIKKKKPMHNFKIGDKVNVYNLGRIYKDRVIEIRNLPLLKEISLILTDGSQVFAKQCRKIKQKPKIKESKLK